MLASGYSSSTNELAIWAVPVNGAPARKEASQGAEGVPSPDGLQIAFISGDRSTIWVKALGSQAPRRLLVGSPADALFARRVVAGRKAAQFSAPPLSGTQDEWCPIAIATTNRPMSASMCSPRGITARIPNIWINSAAMLSDGRLQFLRWDSPGSDYSDELWEVKTDRASGEIRGKPRKIASPVAGTRDHVYGMCSSRDGKRVMVLRRSDTNTITPLIFKLRRCACRAAAA